MGRAGDKFQLSVKIGGAWVDAAEVQTDADTANVVLNLEELRGMIKPMQTVKSKYGILHWAPKA